MTDKQFYISPSWPAPKAIHAFTTTRQGGFSDGRYASMNLAMHVGDKPKSVIKNRQQLIQHYQLPHAPKWLNQVHGNHVLTFKSDHHITNDTSADACMTQTNHTICAVLTADCLPILLCDIKGKEIAAIHAGWRGLSKNIIKATITKMATPPHHLIAWLGPAISKDAFEIGPEVRETFLNQSQAYNSCFTFLQNKWTANLNAIANHQLNQIGIKAIYGQDLCTFSDSTRFFSYRRDGQTGRMATLIWIGS